MMKLLIITDQPEYAEAIIEQVRASGLEFEPLRAASEDELKAAAGGSAPGFVILDYGIKSWEGADALKAARSVLPSAPCLVIGDDFSEKQLLGIFAQGAAGYLPRARLDRVGQLTLEYFKAPAGAVVQASRPSGAAETPEIPAVVYIVSASGAEGWLDYGGDLNGVTGYRREDFRADPLLWARNIHPADRHNAVRCLEETAARGASECEYRWRRADGEYRWFLDKQRLEKEEGGAPRVAGVLVDITSSRRGGERLNSGLRMETVGKLAGSLAHDFHNLLSSILGYSTLVIGNMAAEDPLRDDLSEIQGAAERAITLARQLLVFSRKQSFQQQVLNLNAVFIGMQKMIRQFIKEDIRGVSDLQEGLPAVKADLVNLEQVILGLTMNVCDLMPSGGTLSISTRAVAVGEEECRGVAWAKPGEFVRLRVQGTGWRNAWEFSPQEGADDRGTGLTLPALYGVLRRNGGWMSVKSGEAEGTVFDVFLPVYTGREEAPAPAEEKKTPAALKRFGGYGERILLVEDEEALRKFVGRVLAENGYVVFQAGSVNEALDIFKREKGNFHMVFTDVSLPDRTGVQLAEDLLLLKPNLKIIFNSGYVDEKSQWPAIKQKGLKFLQKPYTIQTMLFAIREVIRRPDL